MRPVPAELELLKPVDLCTRDGRLNRAAVGWSREPVHRADIPAPWGRRKRWDFWGVVAPGCVMNLTVADLDYLGMVDVWLLDRSTLKTFTCSVPVPLARGIELPDKVAAQPIRFEGRAAWVSIDEETKGTRLRVDARAGGHRLEADVLVTRPAAHESLSVVIPWSDKHFQLTTKDVSRPAEGYVRWGNTRYGLAADDGASYGVLDYGRGVWPYRSNWNWGAAAGRARGTNGAVRLGLQLGGKWTVGTGMTENALFVDGRLSKISEELTWNYDPRDWLRPWTIRTPASDRVDVTFTPVYDKKTRVQAVAVESRVDQCFGTYSGTVVDDAGSRITFDALFGWAEEAMWRW
ncbi:MAG: DUF2804 domain-containing protein [Polyangiaceae bacterium]|nr:DUF2804 domain-containing protein [Polyangiaceae bacterium]